MNYRVSLSIPRKKPPLRKACIDDRSFGDCCPVLVGFIGKVSLALLLLDFLFAAVVVEFVSLFLLFGLIVFTLQPVCISFQASISGSRHSLTALSTFSLERAVLASFVTFKC